MRDAKVTTPSNGPPPSFWTWPIVAVVINVSSIDICPVDDQSTVDDDDSLRNNVKHTRVHKFNKQPVGTPVPSTTHPLHDTIHAVEI